MDNCIRKGDLIEWTMLSPMKTGLEYRDFMTFIRDYTDIEVDDAFIKGEVVCVEEQSTIIVEVKEMTQDMFPFTVFANEVKSRLSSAKLESNDPYQRYLCLDSKSMTSLLYYDDDTGYLAEASYDDDGNFVDYSIEDYMDGGEEPMLAEGIAPEQITLRLSPEEIEELEDKDGISIPKGDACSIARVVSWFNTCDCAILSAWRQDKGRKENDDNNKKLQRKLRGLGYGVTKITGWYPEENREMARENSFFVVNLNDERSFRDKIFQQSELYEQDCFLYKKSGYDTPAIYVYTRDVKEYKKGEVKLLGRLRIGNMEAEAYSQIRAGRITFE